MKVEADFGLVFISPGPSRGHCIKWVLNKCLLDWIILDPEDHEAIPKKNVLDVHYHYSGQLFRKEK